MLRTNTALPTAQVAPLGIEKFQFGAIVVVNLAIGMLAPPMGICLIVSGTISEDSITAVYRRALPFLGVLLIYLVVITYFFQFSMWFANMVAK